MKRLQIRKLKRSAGVALFLTLVILVILSIIGFGLVAISISQSKSVALMQRSNQCYYVARIGVASALSNIRSAFNDGNMTYSATYTQDLSSSVGTTSVTITPSPNNGSTYIKAWKIVVVGSFNGSQRTLTCYARTESWAKYCYYTERETSSATSQPIWFTDSDTILGWIHSNGYFSIDGHPKFDNKVTSSNKEDTYYVESEKKYKIGGSSTNKTTNPAKFYHYQTSYTADAPTPVPSPTPQNFYFAGAQPEIFLPTNISDSVSRATQEYDVSDIRITFDSNGTAKIEKPASGGSTWVEDAATSPIDTTNLTLYNTGNIWIKGGTVKGKVTLISGPTSGTTEPEIRIYDSVQYNDDNVDVLGLVSQNDVVVMKDNITHNDLYLDAVIMAMNGSVYVDDYASGSPKGTIYLNGGIMQKKRGPVGTFYSNTGQQASGYSKNYKYDQKLTNILPPNFPTTGKIEIVSIKDSSAFGN